MNNLQPIPGDVDYCVTLNLTDQIDPSKVIYEQNFSHPVFTARGPRTPRSGTPRSAASTARTTAAPTGAGAFTRTACGAASVQPSQVARAAWRDRDSATAASGPESDTSAASMTVKNRDSAIFVGKIGHSRFAPRPRDLQLPGLHGVPDLDELEDRAAPSPFAGSRLFSATEPRGAAQFRREDFLRRRGRSR